MTESRLFNHAAPRAVIVESQPGATLNDAPAAILPATYAFRAVAVPAGRSRIVFTYWPPGLTVGLWVSGLSVMLVALASSVAPPRSQGRDHFAEHTIAQSSDTQAFDCASGNNVADARTVAGPSTYRTPSSSWGFSSHAASVAQFLRARDM